MSDMNPKMNQDRLLSIWNKLMPGTRFTIDEYAFRECFPGEHRSALDPAYRDAVRRSFRGDASADPRMNVLPREQAIEWAERNGVRLIENQLSGRWTMEKPERS